MTNSYNFLIEELLPVVNERCAVVLRDADKRALASWYSRICEDGHLEVGAFNSATGRPVILRFTAENQAEIDAIETKIDALRKAGEDDAAGKLSDTIPAPIWGK